MIPVVGIRFKKAGKIYYFDPGDTGPELHNDVIVETSRGIEMGKVVIPLRNVQDDAITQPLKSIIRIATDRDRVQYEKNKEKEARASEICLEKIAYHKLPMKLVDVSYTFDGGKIIFFFTAEGRVDFRELVKDLAPIFKTRIELRQIGLRDEAKMINGIGGCGRPLCCANVLSEFTPVSIKMAKDQNLSLNPTKISGVCGRLLCCLNYENDLYIKGGELRQKQAKKAAAPVIVEPPGIGKEVMTAEGVGKVLKINRDKKRVKVQLDGGRAIDLDWVDIILPEED